VDFDTIPEGSVEFINRIQEVESSEPIWTRVDSGHSTDEWKVRVYSNSIEKSVILFVVVLINKKAFAFTEAINEFTGCFNLPFKRICESRLEQREKEG
jgi:hypothetical protein